MYVWNDMGSRNIIIWISVSHVEYNQEALLTLADSHVQLITVASQQILFFFKHCLQTCTATFNVFPVPVLMLQLFPIHPLPATNGALSLQAEPEADSAFSCGIEESEVLLPGAQDGHVHIMPLTKCPGFEPGHRSPDQVKWCDDSAKCKVLAHSWVRGEENDVIIDSFSRLSSSCLSGQIFSCATLNGSLILIRL